MTDNRNVTNYYKYWETDAIKADLDTKRHNFSVLCVNIQGDFNLGSVIRNSNAFLAKEVIIYGKRQFDRRSTVGTHLYSNLRHVKLTDDLDSVIKDSVLIGMDNVSSAIPIESFNWPTDQHVIMAFGEENSGLPPELLDRCDKICYITQYGSVRSLNVGCASGIAMYDYCKKMKG